MIDLEPARQNTLVCMRLRSFNQGEPAFLRPPLEGIVPRPDTTFTAALYGVLLEGDLIPEHRFSSVPLSESVTDSSEAFLMPPDLPNENRAGNSYETEFSESLHNLSW